jgi:hypothetical protein
MATRGTYNLTDEASQDLIFERREDSLSRAKEILQAVATSCYEFRVAVPGEAGPTTYEEYMGYIICTDTTDR